MMTRKRWLLLCVVVTVAAVAGFWAFPSQQRQVRNRLFALAGAATIRDPESDMSRLARGAAVGGFLAPDVTVDAGVEGLALTGRETVIGIIVKTPAPPGGLKVELSDVIVTVASDSTRADATAVASLTSREPGAAQPSIETYRVTFVLRRIDRTWCVSAVQLVQEDPARSRSQSRRQPRLLERSSRWS